MRGSQVIVGPTDRGMAKCYDSQSVEERYSSKWLGFKWNHLYALHFSQYVPRLFASTQHKFAKKKQKNVREFQDSIASARKPGDNNFPANITGKYF